MASSIQRVGIGARMSKIVKHNGTIYLCGQVGAEGSTGITEQTTTMLKQVDELLATAGSSRKNILSCTVYIKDMADFAAMNAVYDAWVVEGHTPARACVQATMASPELLVEISVIAAENVSDHA